MSLEYQIELYMDKALLKRNQDRTALLDLEMTIEKLRADFRPT